MNRYYELASREYESMPINDALTIREFSGNLVYIIDLYIIYLHLLDGSIISLILRSFTQICLSLPQHRLFLRTFPQHPPPSDMIRDNDGNSTTFDRDTSSSTSPRLLRKNMYAVFIMNLLFMIRHIWIAPGNGVFLDMLGTGGPIKVDYLLGLDIIFMLLQWMYIRLPYYKRITDLPAPALTIFSLESDISADTRV
jgi:hypothetical protein